MRKTVLTYGFISGAIAAVFMLATMPFIHSLHGHQGYVVGYTGIVLATLLVFFGVRSYRENVGNGRITFGRGFLVGILITLISCTCYVATWQLIYYKLAPGITDKIFSAPVEKLRAEGAAQDKIDAAQRQVDSFKKMYDNPLINAGFTFIEPFPVGLLITLISAAVLRRK
jgi:Protein of unknown function (DUF4199)